MERRFRGIWIPCEIWLSNELSLQEKVFLVEIDSLDSEESGCFASNAYFSDFFKLSKARVSQVISSLEEKGYISVSMVREGRQVVRRVIHINAPPYPEIVSSKDSDHGSKFPNEGGKFPKGGSKYPKDPYLGNYEDNNTLSNKPSNNTGNNYRPQARFTPPSLDDVRAYCQERHNSISPERFVDYYTSNGWRVGKNPMKDWKAAVRTWERNNIRSTQEEGNPFLEILREEEERKYGSCGDSEDYVTV